MFWVFLHIMITTLSGIIVPESVVIPESTLVPPEVFIEQQSALQSVTNREVFAPVLLIIPSIGVNAAIDPVGLTEKGAIGSPTEPGLLGWFDQSPIPGEKGSAIIDGHRGWRNSTPAVFDNLKDVTRGDMVIVMNNQGDTLPFEVYDIKTYDPDESPPEVFATSDTMAFLNLITCNGEWDVETHSATERLVVFTKRTEDR